MSKMDALDIANAFIERAGASTGELGQVSPLKLQKVLYYAQGWHLALQGGEALFKDKVYAWRYGPVVRSVYDKYKRFGHSNLAISEALPPAEPVTDSAVNTFLDNVWNQYGAIPAEDLVARTHNNGPWQAAYRDPYSDEISQDAMFKYFSSLPS